MNRLKKILLSFVLPFFCLLISVSYAEEFVIGNTYKYASVSSDASNNGSFLGTNSKTIIQTIENRFSSSNNETTEQLYNDLLSVWESNNYKYVIYKQLDSGFINVLIFTKELDSNGIPYSDFGIGTTSPDISNAGTYIYFFGPTTSTSTTLGCRIYKDTNAFGTVVYGLQFNKNSSDSCCYTRRIDTSFELITNTDIKQMIVTDTSTSYGFPITWEGEYYYQVSGGEDTPSLPSNADIAKAVQAFYNSDYYKNNTDFDDFIVLYDKTTQLYSFIGHTVPEWLMQEIIPPNMRFKGFSFDVQWWMFTLNENSGAPAYGTKYYLYSTDINAETITYNGVDTISNLVLNPWSVDNTVIVYSTHDYTVRTYVLDESTGDYVYTEGIIQGDQYTYDEDLDITDNKYNPLDKFVTVDPSQTIVDNADFGNLSDSFEEHKELFSFSENMQWLIIANNKLSNYFLGFIVLSALFITLGRVLKG